MQNRLKSPPQYHATVERQAEVHVQHINAGLDGMCEIHNLRPETFALVVKGHEYELRLAYLTLGEMLGMVEKPPVHEKKHWWIWK